MTIEKKMDGTKCTLAIGGRLDTTTAPELDKEVQNLESTITDLTLDFGTLDYISSAGLRVVLTAQKKMNVQGGMQVVNVNEVVNEVFEITGFADILTIK